MNQIFNALRFLYVGFYKMPFYLGDIPRTRKQHKLPVVLGIQEIKMIFDAVDNLKHKTILMLIYSAGLRIGEAVKTQAVDINSTRKMIHIRDAKKKGLLYHTFGYTPLD